MNINETRWSAGVTCEKTLETTTVTTPDPLTSARRITTIKSWKAVEAYFDLDPAAPETTEQVCPYCGNTFRVATAPRRDVTLTAEDVEKKFAANIRKRLLQLLLLHTHHRGFSARAADG